MFKEENRKMREKVILKLYKEWVKGKVYKDVADNPRKYREFCALVSFTPEDGETKTYLPYSRSSDMSFKVSDIKVGDILYMGYVNEYKGRTILREYCKVIEKSDDAIMLIDGYKSYLSALEDNPDTTHLDNGE